MRGSWVRFPRAAPSAFESDSCIALQVTIIRGFPELQKSYFFYIWNEEIGEVRWMTSFDASPADIEGFVSAVEEVINLE